MQVVMKWLNSDNSFSKAFNWSITIGCLTIIFVILVGKSGNPYIWSFAHFLGGIGNDLFLISTNILIIVWAWRQRLRSIISLTLGVDLLVLIIVQGIKLLKISPWYLRPNGGVGGFPSGHATHAFGMAFLLTLFFPRFAWLWYAIAAAISWSRVETDWHTGFQVAVGVILGIVIVWGMVIRWLKHQNAVVIQTAPQVQGESVQSQPVVLVE
ncbi:hypothetical protein SPSIL_029250 [Sporomusa silvacetica DSM 10669]|uniref:Phosphatidic acid phosphatase type 2/haloperoxidase domain-containing protein n=1 Tax=Sporomusa silvacetica DSM 10669 TaxID=1123289 RepID=A0ABZ3IME5_9FIRM|nr:phosphatase PAP2 family protein [Sporomusa silvacetica]OZC15725.1 PAP2 superfamily protein [Sporomusa silvacetica DSM 10669]